MYRYYIRKSQHNSMRWIIFLEGNYNSVTNEKVFLFSINIAYDISIDIINITSA